MQRAPDLKSSYVLGFIKFTTQRFETSLSRAEPMEGGSHAVAVEQEAWVGCLRLRSLRGVQYSVRGLYRSSPPVVFVRCLAMVIGRNRVGVRGCSMGLGLGG